MKSVSLGVMAGMLLFCSVPAFAQTYPASAPSAATAPVISSDGKLYGDFGGHDGLVALMDDFMVILLADPRTKDFFVAVDQTRVKWELVSQFCQILGGGCTYTGKDMKTVHAKLGVHQADFLALVEDLQIAMDRKHIPFRAQNQLLAALAPQHRDVVTEP
ncbi:group 1 truncated hemoglobin [Asticcacaulis sp. 201]|uniref:group I truncated hemoglobin n=1 Tax=Asticcacaulis sp. 201 TaxID=3028787 RepID=UPI0029168379|nr:group 1 truncated hemoglobin [Asticcacaulis sp. 201]MDV6331721.1 group 1 truncated hemoglobin [Asticcacaulis sp. 201]